MAGPWNRFIRIIARRNSDGGAGADHAAEMLEADEAQTMTERRTQRFLPEIKRGKRWLIDVEHDRKLIGPFDSWADANDWIKVHAIGEKVDGDDIPTDK